MAKYYLDLHECGENVIPDHDGIDAQHPAAAKALAITAARDIMCGEIGRGTLCLSCFIEVRDERRDLIERVMFRDAVTITGLREQSKQG